MLSRQQRRSSKVILLASRNHRMRPPSTDPLITLPGVVNGGHSPIH